MPTFARSKYTQIVQFRTTIEQRKAIEREAKKYKQGVSDVIREAMDLYFASKLKERSGSAGSKG